MIITGHGKSKRSSPDITEITGNALLPSSEPDIENGNIMCNWWRGPVL